MTARFEQKPGSSLGLVDPSLEQTRASDITMLFADATRFSHRGCKLLVVFPKFSKHVEGSNVVGIIIVKTLQPRDLANGPDSDPTNFSHPFGDGIGHAKDLITLFVQKKMIIAEVRSGHMPVEVFGFEVEREYIG